MGNWKELNEAPRYLRVLMTGQSGTGKTILGLKFPSPGLLPTEEGHLHYRNDPSVNAFTELRPANETTGWTFDEMLRDVKAMQNPMSIPTITQTGKKIETLIIDTITGVLAGVQGILFTEQMDIIARTKSRTDKNSVVHKDWGDMGRRYGELLEALDKLPLNVVVIGRMKPDEKGIPQDYVHHSTDYFFDVVVQLRHTQGEHRTLTVWKDRTKHFSRHLKIADPTFDNFFKPILDDLTAGRVVPLDEIGSKEPVKAMRKAVEPKTLPVKETKEPPKKPTKEKPVKKDTKKKATKKKPEKKDTKKDKVLDHFEIGTMTHGGKELEYYKPNDTVGKRTFLQKIWAEPKHPLRSNLNQMLGGSETKLLPENTDDDEIDMIWEMLIEHNSEITINE